MEQKDAAGGYDRERDTQITALRNRLFNKYVAPYYNMIYKLCIEYTFDKHNIEENYTEALVNLYRGIETYDTSRSILTWLHSCTKRCIYKRDKARWIRAANTTDTVNVSSLGDNTEDIEGHVEIDLDNWQNYVSDPMVRALSSLPKTHRDAFLLQQCGYSLKEIAAMEVEKGTLTYENIETIKRRVFNARKILREKLTRDGESRQIDTEDNNDLFNGDEAAGGLQI